jgi:hypothetical protein
MTTASTHHSFVGFAIGRLGVSKVRGRFDRFDAEIVIVETLDTTDADRGKARCRRPFRCRLTSAHDCPFHSGHRRRFGVHGPTAS